MGALALIPWPSVGAVAGALLAALIVFSLVRNFTVHVFMRGEHAVTELLWTREGEWRLRERGGRECVCRLRHDSYAHPFLTVLNFAGDRRCSVVLLPDSLDRDTFRRLRVRLGLHGANSAEDGYPV